VIWSALLQSALPPPRGCSPEIGALEIMCTTQSSTLPEARASRRKCLSVSTPSNKWRVKRETASVRCVFELFLLTRAVLGRRLRPHLNFLAIG
jgi:hypothetical protein